MYFDRKFCHGRCFLHTYGVYFVLGGRIGGILNYESEVSSGYFIYVPVFEKSNGRKPLRYPMTLIIVYSPSFWFLR